MIMRYYRSLGVGHTHQASGGGGSGTGRHSQGYNNEDAGDEDGVFLGNGTVADDEDEDASGSEIVSGDLSEEEEPEEDFGDDAELLARAEMYDSD
jgi:hypothetical protein